MFFTLTPCTHADTVSSMCISRKKWLSHLPGIRSPISPTTNLTTTRRRLFIYLSRARIPRNSFLHPIFSFLSLCCRRFHNGSLHFLPFSHGYNDLATGIGNGGGLHQHQHQQGRISDSLDRVSMAPFFLPSAYSKDVCRRRPRKHFLTHQPPPRTLLILDIIRPSYDTFDDHETDICDSMTHGTSVSPMKWVTPIKCGTM